MHGELTDYFLFGLLSWRADSRLEFVMRTEIIDGKLTVKIIDLLESLSSETALEVVESLACTEAVIKHVADQIIEGRTENYYHGYKSAPSESPSTALGRARRLIAEASGEIAREEIAGLCKEMESLKGRLSAAYAEIGKYERAAESRHGRGG
jgi:hypothetical protein